nr:MAG TPA: hypothetical protein [Caudoviricetes sp.]
MIFSAEKSNNLCFSISCFAHIHVAFQDFSENLPIV